MTDKTDTGACETCGKPAPYDPEVITCGDCRVEDMTDDQLEGMVGWTVGRSHVSVSDKGIRSTVGRKLSKTITGARRQRVLDAAVRVHNANQKFFTDMRF